MSLQVLCVSNNLYINHLFSLISSLSICEPNATLHCFLVNVPTNTIEFIEKIKNVKVYIVQKEFKEIKDESNFCANIRMEYCFDLLNSGVDHIVYLDVDSIVRKPLEFVQHSLKSHDFVFFKRNSDDPRLKFASGVFAIKGNKSGLKFLYNWKERAKILKFEWFTDQISLHETFEESKRPLNWIQLPKEYIDWDFNKDSAIWVGKGTRKFENLKYRFLERYYIFRLFASNIRLFFKYHIYK